MRKTSLRLSLILLASSVVISAFAAGNVRYKWRDADGNLHYSDSLPADANVYGYDIVSAQGIVVKHVPAAMTPDQRAAARIEAAEVRSAKDEAERQNREDQQLLAANPTEADLLNSQKQQIEMIDLSIKSLDTGLQSLDRNLTDLLGRAADLERDNMAVPARLTAQIADVRSKINAQHTQMERRQAEREKTAQGFAEELDRYRALRDKYKNR
ncbi:MAG: DUF4124 domain-containing protein [Xanthomonadales bacterium]|uniref:DUF4124 domain-containing protein n=1 Tax=Dokdonella sp. TaxID=2291710 RepID=UPI002BE4AEC5|nr:DUF4124 domain-containing protein [Xanthomonadales bacterium]MBK7210513.1 DUF4124 domain-containing protein [Xanthomonadales bacterium]MBL0223965.1 DUF4124 domain-containing protein [Xanthomonadales bacterium]HQX65404.1 DUF4124 domain-containing protein [Dokdonella sp.]HQY54975.1 DUF4124 domain-containing protein [Dokdonella sp.]